MTAAKPRIFKTPADWRAWLEKNHDRAREIWLVYYKKASGKKSVAYSEALDQALCFGWIDSTVRRLDEEKYMQRFSPRKPGSIWALSNVQRAGQLPKSRSRHHADAGLFQ